MMEAEDSAGTMAGKEFPVYLSSADGRHFYRIAAADRFEEIQVVGTRRILHHIVARAYPELVRVQELLGMSGTYHRSITAAEWERQLTLVN